VPQPTIKVLESTVGLGQRFCFGLAAIVLAPVAEEALFRGILYPFIKQSGHRWLALFGTSLAFGAVHANLVTFVPLSFFAVILVFVYEKTDKLLAPILTHALFNAVNFFAFIFHWPK
jgi:membrane protease YdiL (CAAX protease family)